MDCIIISSNLLSEFCQSKNMSSIDESVILTYKSLDVAILIFINTHFKF